MRDGSLFEAQRHLQHFLNIREAAASVGVIIARAYPQQPPPAACYITEKLYAQHRTNVARVKTHITGGYEEEHRTKSLSKAPQEPHKLSRGTRERSMAQHGAVIQQRLLPSRLHKSSTPWLLAMVVCGVWVLGVHVSHCSTPSRRQCIAVGFNPEVSGRRRRRQISHETAGVLRGDLLLRDGSHENVAFLWVCILQIRYL